MADASIQFQNASDGSPDRHMPPVQIPSSHQTGVARPRSTFMRVAPLSGKNASSSGRRTAWEVNHSADSDNLLDPPLPYDAYTGGKSYRDFPT